MIALLDPRVWLAALVVCLAAYGAGRWHQYRYDGRAQAQAVLEAVEQARAEEQRRTHEQERIASEATQQAAKARDDARAAVGSAERLRQRVAALRCDPAAAASGPAASDPIGVLADVLRRADERAGLLAEYADSARIAGLACERSYDALTAP